jgi:hypothetical protein
VFFQDAADSEELCEDALRVVVLVAALFAARADRIAARVSIVVGSLST